MTFGLMHEHHATEMRGIHEETYRINAMIPANAAASTAIPIVPMIHFLFHSAIPFYFDPTSATASGSLSPRIQ